MPGVTKCNIQYTHTYIFEYANENWEWIVATLRWLLSNASHTRTPTHAHIDMCLYEKTPTFFFIITVKNRQNSWHTITKHKQQCCNHSCPTRRKKKRKKVEKTLPGIYSHSSSYSCSCSFRIRTMSGSVTSVWIIRKLPEPSQNEWWRTTNRRWQQQHPKPTNDNPTVDGRQSTTHCIIQLLYAFYFMLYGPTAVDIIILSTSSSSGWQNLISVRTGFAVRLASPLVSCSFSFSFSFSLMHSFVLIV